jgi:hypothetical protein
MPNVCDTAVEVLSAIVGPIPAQMCIRAACVALGKPAEGVVPEDFGMIAAKIRRDMSPFASPDLIEGALAQIAERIA